MRLHGSCFFFFFFDLNMFVQRLYQEVSQDEVAKHGAAAESREEKKKGSRKEKLKVASKPVSEEYFRQVCEACTLARLSSNKFTI